MSKTMSLDWGSSHWTISCVRRGRSRAARSALCRYLSRWKVGVTVGVGIPEVLHMPRIAMSNVERTLESDRSQDLQFWTLIHQTLTHIDTSGLFLTQDGHDALVCRESRGPRFLLHLGMVSALVGKMRHDSMYLRRAAGAAYKGHVLILIPPCNGKWSDSFQESRSSSRICRAKARELNEESYLLGVSFFFCLFDLGFFVDMSFLLLPDAGRGSSSLWLGDSSSSFSFSLVVDLGSESSSSDGSVKGISLLFSPLSLDLVAHFSIDL